MAVRELAARQAGNFTRRQLLSVGLSGGAIKARLRNGSWVARCHGIYCQAPPRQDPPALATAAVLACGPGAVLSHFSAAYLWGFVTRWEPEPEVTLAEGDRRPRGILTHRCPSLKRRDITRQRGIPTTSPARTILDIAPRLAAKERTRLVNDARREGFLHPDSFSDVLARNPHHPGTRLLTPFAEDPSNPTRSPFEDDFLVFVAEYGLPTPEINTMVNGHEVDAYFPEHNLIVELDGWDFHKDREAFETDRERDAEHLKYGVRTLRITKQRMRATPDREAARVREILQRGQVPRNGVLGSSYGLLPEL